MKISAHKINKLIQEGTITDFNQYTSNYMPGILAATFTIGNTEITCQSSVDIEGWYGFHVINSWEEFDDGDRIAQYDQGKQIEPDEGQEPIEKLQSYEN